MRFRSTFALCALLSASVTSASATPYVPADDDEVVERLPASPFATGAAELQTVRRRLEAEPANLDLAARTAWQHIQQGRATSDPRFYGYAQGVLAPWWNDPEPPASVLVLRATIRQHDHDFETALGDLELALRADPMNAQAWLTQAVVLQVRGRYAEAKRSCMQMLPLTTPLVAVTCISSVESLNGGAAKSYEALRRALARSGSESPAARLWGLTLLAEIAARAGRVEEADAHFRQAMAAAPADDYLRGAYADFLLDQRRPEAVRDLLRDSTRSDGLLLRLAVAEQQLTSPELAEHVAALQQRFEAAHRRGDDAHAREEARYQLELLHEPAAALVLAQRNWEVQREPLDARLLMQAALAAGQPEAAAPALEFVAATGIEDAALVSLAAALGSPRR